MRRFREYSSNFVMMASGFDMPVYVFTFAAISRRSELLPSARHGWRGSGEREALALSRAD